MVESKKSFCRFCHVFCGIEVDIEEGHVQNVRGDRENEVTQGYTCQKGRAEPERIHHDDRILAPRKRVGDSWKDVGLREALDEVAERLSDVVDQHGPESVAIYTGCGGHRTSAGGPWFVRRWLQALGSTKMYTSYTIDSPSLTIAGNRFFGGPLPANVLDVERAECALFVGTNPAASHQLNMPQSSPSARIKQARKKGMKVIVVDPRRSDVARMADLHLQVKPGEDATLLAAMVKVILDRGLQDHEYCDQFVSGVEELHEAVSRFDLDYAAMRSGVPADMIAAAAEMFATAQSGGGVSGTGMHMAPHHNLATQLVMTLNGLCGRVDRPGGMVHTDGALSRPITPDMEAGRLPTPPKSRIRGISGINGLFGSYFELPTNTLADEILTPGDGQIRALIVNGGNPALVLPEAESAVRALKDLDLLVVLDLFPSATAEFADYVFGVRHPFERADVSKLMDAAYPFPFAHYTAPLLEGPEETIEEWQVFWEIAMRMGLPLRVGSLHAAEGRPTSDELLDAMYKHARFPLSEMRQYPSGIAFAERHMAAGGVIPNLIAHEDKKMAAGHPEVLSELREVRAEPVSVRGDYSGKHDFDFRLITYRMKEVYCTQGHNLPSLAAKRPYNPVLMNPKALEGLGLETGDHVWLESDQGRVEGIVEMSDDVGPHTIACAFGWGNENDASPVSQKGTNVQRLISDDDAYDPVTGLARQSAIPVNIRPMESH